MATLYIEGDARVGQVRVPRVRPDLQDLHAAPGIYILPANRIDCARTLIFYRVFSL